MTLKEIADKVGVSVSTVSRVVNQSNPKAASTETQKRIWDEVHKSGYEPNKAAQLLKNGAVQIDDLSEPRAIACIYNRSDATMTDPFFTHIAHSVEREAFKNHMFVKYTFSTVGLSEQQLRRSLADVQVDGVIILGRSDDETIDTICRHIPNAVYVGLNPIPPKIDQVICEGYDAAMAAMDYLLELGHKSIAYIGEIKKEVRFSAYKDKLAQQGISYSPANVVEAVQSSEGGYLAAKRLLDRETDITAVFCANDVTAIGVMRALKERGINNPGDISIIGIDDIETSRYISPMLTTIHIPRDELGKVAVQTLSNQIKKLHRLPMKISLPFYVVKRESCGRVSV